MGSWGNDGEATADTGQAVFTANGRRGLSDPDGRNEIIISVPN